MNNNSIHTLINFLKNYWYIYVLLIILNLIKYALKKYKLSVEHSLVETSTPDVFKSLPSDKYKVLTNIMVKSPIGPTLIDHLIISIYGVFIVKTVSVDGLIKVELDSTNWESIINEKKEPFPNPINTIKDNIAVLYNLNPLFRKYIDFIPIVFFTGDVNFKNNLENVTNSTNIEETISKYNEVIYTESDVLNIFEYITKKNVTSLKARKKYIKKLAKDG